MFWLLNHSKVPATFMKQMFDSRLNLEQEMLCLEINAVQQQLDHLYGPLLMLMVEGQRTFQALVEMLEDTPSVGHEASRWTSEERVAWNRWMATTLFPLHKRIIVLFSTQPHLMVNGKHPAYFASFIAHGQSWQSLRERWSKGDFSGTWNPTLRWPCQFTQEVIDISHVLKAKHLSLLKKVSKDAFEAFRESQGSIAIPESPPVINPAHLVQFYRKDPLLIKELSTYVTEGLSKQESCILIATQTHREAIEDHLSEQGFDMVALHDRKAYLTFDALETLPKLMVHGLPDPKRFVSLIGSQLAQMTLDGQQVRAFGELVSVL